MAQAENTQFYHDRCIPATPCNLLLRESLQRQNPYAIVKRKARFAVGRA
jgi:hypothetical protein